jgi:MFS family permease
MLAVGAFEMGNVATTLLILRATQLLEPGRSHTTAVQLALGAYVLYNVAATLTSIPAGRLGDLQGNTLVFGIGTLCFLGAYLGFATGSLTLLVLAFVVAGVAIGCVETAEHTAVASLAAIEVRGSAFGLLAGVQSLGNVAASAIAGVLWSTISPTVAFLYLAGWMGVSLLTLGWIQMQQWSTDA